MSIDDVGGVERRINPSLRPAPRDVSDIVSPLMYLLYDGHYKGWDNLSGGHSVRQALSGFARIAGLTVEQVTEIYKATFEDAQPEFTLDGPTADHVVISSVVNKPTTTYRDGKR